MNIERRKASSCPVIGIVPRYNPETVNFEFPETFTIPILKHRALPLLIPYTQDESLLSEYLGCIDALMVIGGLDVDPSEYTSDPTHPSVTRTIPHYDAFEFSILRWAYDNDIPTFGICRGAQVMNVCFGGTLIQDLPSLDAFSFQHYQPEPFTIPRHDVFISEGSELAEICGPGVKWVNSMHHQAILDVADGFSINAVSSDGITEGIEALGKRLFIGVQWHPEDMYTEMGLSPVVARILDVIA